MVYMVYSLGLLCYGIVLHARNVESWSIALNDQHYNHHNMVIIYVHIVSYKILEILIIVL